MRLAEPVIAYDRATGLWTLQEMFQCQTSAGLIRIQAGFRFDGLSIPRILWRVVGHPLQGDALPGGTIHDALYAAKLLSRAKVDALFLEVMRLYGVNPVKAVVMYAAVRSFGWLAWQNKRGDACRAARRLVAVH